MPKCPACLALFLAPLGVAVPRSKWFLAYAVLLLAALPMAFLLSRTCRHCGVRPLLLALSGVALMTVGRIGFDSGVAVAAGSMVLITAVVWVARLSAPSRTCTESHSA